MTDIRCSIMTYLGEIWKDPEGKLCIKLKENIEIDKKGAEYFFAIYEEFGYGSNNKALQLIHDASYFMLEKTARNYAAEKGKHFFTASAIITDKLHIRIMFNLFNRIYKHEVPFRLFSNENKARKWLMSFLNVIKIRPSHS